LDESSLCNSYVVGDDADAVDDDDVTDVQRVVQALRVTSTVDDDEQAWRRLVQRRVE
jgi:hypothetical protein